MKPPKCAGCLYGAMAKHLYHTKSVNNLGSIWEAYAPGECISVHHMEYSTPGFISQLKGKPIKQRYRAATILLDHCNDLTYMHLQRISSSEETAESKKELKAYVRTYKVKIKHYHIDNGKFEYHAFIQAVTQESQTLSYCGVNAHLQNEKAESASGISNKRQGNISITKNKYVQAL